MSSRGFTVVELLVVIIIMAILLTLAVVNVRASQANARDNTRTVNVESIVSLLDTYYSSGASNAAGGSGYPGLNAIANEDTLLTYLPGTDAKIFRAPGVSGDDPISLIPATNTDRTVETVQPTPTLSTFVYQPIAPDGTLCVDNNTTPCRSFTIFYRLEVSTPECPAPYNLCSITGRHQ